MSTYQLVKATDKRDGKVMLWLLSFTRGKTLKNEKSYVMIHRVAQFHAKTAPSRIKHLTAAAPDGISWGPGETWAIHAEKNTAESIDTWEMPS